MDREVNILIMGASGSGKSKLGDLIRNTIFKMDASSKVCTTDPDRENKDFGSGKNIYNVTIKKLTPEELALRLDIPPDELENDVIIILTSGTVGRWFQEVTE